jgi:hypothetical protein
MSPGSAASLAEDEDDTDELTMEDFNTMMDTLAMQPNDTKRQDDEEVVVGLLPVEGFSAELSNKMNGVAAAFNSEKGSRHTQEDRCVLVPSVAAMQMQIQSQSQTQAQTQGQTQGTQGQTQGAQAHTQGSLDRANPTKLEQLGKFTIGCIFDGHSGWRCAQYLSQHFVSVLVAHEGFLDKTCEKALIDSCATIDARVCDLLLDEEDASGCTGVITVFDGRRNLFTVASVGDSMCVLSRSGIAVMLNKMHRVDNEEERKRVIQAGGTIVNHR